MKEKSHKSDRKHKKSKKHKKRSKRSSSSSSESSGEMEWVEAPAPKQTRDDWMNSEQFVATLSKNEMLSGSSREKKRAAQLEIMEKDEELRRQRELNPHWKNNGSGLPEEESNVESLRLPSSSVGDGGYAYLKKAYLRIQEQAQSEGRSMEEIAVERWGSLEKLVSMIDEAEARMRTHSKTRYSSDDRWRREDVEERSGSKSKHFHKPHHRSPSPDRSFRYRKPETSGRDRKKLFNVTSSKRKHSHYSSSDWREADDDSPRSSRHIDAVAESSSKGKTDVKGSFSAPTEQRIPAWKKVVKPEENMAKVRNDDLTSKPSTSEKPSYGCVDARPVQETKQDDEPATINSEDDLNRLAAKYMKADLMGDKVLAEKLKAELDEAREAFKSGKSSGIRSSAREQERVMLTKMDSSGHQRPIQSSREDAGFERRTGRKKQSNKYVDDSSRYSLKQMFNREKLTTADDNIEMFIDIAGECRETMGDEETAGISKKATHKMAHSVQEEKDIGKAIRQHQKMSAALERCEYCLDQPNMKRHLIVTMCEQVYLCIPNFNSLTDGHCLIVPKRHVSSFLNLEEDEWRSFEELRSLLRNFFRHQQKRMLCIETSMNFGRCPHAYIECIPVPEEDSDMAPLYFKKAILESEEEWAHNVKLVDLTKKGIRHSVPKNLPYFWISFDPAVHGGYAHVIEDEKIFQRNFGKEVIGGMLDIDYNYLYKNRKDDPLKKSKEALAFTKSFEKFQEDNLELLQQDL